MKKKIVILGATGSIGTRTLDVMRDFPDRFSVVGLSTFGKTDLLKKQIEEFQPKVVNVTDPEKAIDFRKTADISDCKITSGSDGLSELVEICKPDICVVATVGIAGLLPTLKAIELGSDVALANKEVLVAGGDLVVDAISSGNSLILPIDSEHNAIMECLQGENQGSIRRIILTASGGPFRNYSLEDLKSVTPKEALNHPTWNMGPKITIDSATMMNKGFEVIEAHHLFKLPVDNISVFIHPQSIVHSMVEFIDGSIKAQLSVTDMYLTIQSALFFPERLPNDLERLDLTAIQDLSFDMPRKESFPCLEYAYEASRKGGTAPAALNAANEVAVRRFLENDIAFQTIPEIIRKTLDLHENKNNPELEDILQADRITRKKAEKL